MGRDDGHLAVEGEPDPAGAPRAYGDTYLARLGHRLIRAYNGDTLDPFMLPSVSPGEIMCSCFYYSVAIHPTITLLYDNFGRGGMCDHVWEEVQAAWPTRDILDRIGMTYEDLQACVDDVREVPAMPEPNAELLELLGRVMEEKAKKRLERALRAAIEAEGCGAEGPGCDGDDGADSPAGPGMR